MLTAILEKLNEKGWNLYRQSEDSEGSIKNGPITAENIILNEPYVILPVAEDPSEPEQVWAVLEELAIKHDRKIPEIYFSGRGYPMIGITIGIDRVKVHSPTPAYVTPNEFLCALDSFVSVTN